MEWSGDAIVLSPRRHGESSAIVTLMTREHGRHVAEALECPPGAIFFIDDNVINFEAGRACGFEAHVAKGPE